MLNISSIANEYVTRSKHCPCTKAVMFFVTIACALTLPTAHKKIISLLLKFMDNLVKITEQNVTEFVKRGLPHTCSFLTLKDHNLVFN